MKNIKNHIFIILVLCVAAILRFTQISSVPPALNWDEISHGYNAYSLLQSGKDEWGETLPIIFRAYGDYKLPVYIYSIVPSIVFLGLTEFAVRLPSVLAGIGSVFFTYLLVSELINSRWLTVKDPKDNFQITNHKSLPLIASLLMALEPWSVFLSRGAFEANLSQFFIIGGVYYLLSAIRYIEQNEFKSRDLIVSISLLGLSVWTYNSARVFVPLLLVCLIVVFWKELKLLYKKLPYTIYYTLFIAAVLLLPMFYQLANPVGFARYSKVQILDEGAINQINEGRNMSNLQPLLARLVHNKVTYFTKEFAVNYTSHFNPKFLFTQGGSQYQFSIPGHGLLYVINLPFFYLGLALVIRSALKFDHDNLRKRANWWVLVLWFLLAPIPSSLTREAPHVLRSITLLPVPMIATSIGYITFLEFLKNKLTINKFKLANGIYIGLLFVSLCVYLNRYFTEYRQNYSWSWQYGYKEVVRYTKVHYSKYDKIIVTKKYGEPHEFFLFYNAWDPEMYRNDPNLIRFAQSDWFWVDSFDKYYFVNDWQVNEKDTGNYTFNLESKEVVHCTPKMFDCLLITSPNNAPDGWNRIESIYFLNGETAFDLYENIYD